MKSPALLSFLLVLGVAAAWTPSSATAQTTYGSSWSSASFEIEGAEAAGWAILIGSLAIDAGFLISDAIAGFRMGRAHAKGQIWWGGISFAVFGVVLVSSIMAEHGESIAMAVGLCSLSALLVALGARALVIDDRQPLPIDVSVSPWGATATYTHAL